MKENVSFAWLANSPYSSYNNIRKVGKRDGKVYGNLVIMCTVSFCISSYIRMPLTTKKSMYKPIYGSLTDHPLIFVIV